MATETHENIVPSPPLRQRKWITHQYGICALPLSHRNRTETCRSSVARTTTCNTKNIYIYILYRISYAVSNWIVTLLISKLAMWRSHGFSSVTPRILRIYKIQWARAHNIKYNINTIHRKRESANVHLSTFACSKHTPNIYAPSFSVSNIIYAYSFYEHNTYICAHAAIKHSRKCGENIKSTVWACAQTKLCAVFGTQCVGNHINESACC